MAKKKNKKKKKYSQKKRSSLPTVFAITSFIADITVIITFILTYLF
ncbi:hypothetical protein [Paraclostridium sordellii]|nr:hypothetical protein [Paeniclostridium sordellii]